MAAEINNPGNSGRLLSFSTDGINDGIEVIDHIERCRCQIIGSRPISPKVIPSDEFSFPVDRAVKITTNRLVLPYSVAVLVRNGSGVMIDELTNEDFRQFPRDHYSLELSAPIKLYLNIKSSFEIEVTSDKVVVFFNKQTDVYIGARSHHEQPAATIKTSDDPEDMMQAVSFLSSALKTTSCERAYPTLRGHPPTIILGDNLQVPSVLNRAETGVTIEVPENYQSIYVMSPLAYYFGADMVPGDEHRIRTDDGFIHEFGNMKYGTESEIKEVLMQCFFLDCITRTEGYYQVHLHEREQIESEINLDFGSLYNCSIQEQIKKYLAIPFDIIEPYLPQWKQTVYVECRPNNIENIPFFLHDLAAIRSADNARISRVEKNGYSAYSENKEGLDISGFSRQKLKQPNEFLRGSPISQGDTRSTRKNASETSEYIKIPESKSFEQVWAGTGIPIGASKAMTEAFRNRLRRTPVEDDINITVIVNDDQMEREGVIADEIYGSREQLSFEINEHRGLTTEELHDVLRTDADFLHYIGHIDEGGFDCDDGQLDVTELDEVGVDSFLLNACSSYEQAIGLINAGAIAGIATLKPVLNSGAERIGKAIARLLNLGFPLVAALYIAKSKSIMGDNYVIIGDGSVNLTQSKSGTPSACEITESDEEDNFNLTYKTYLTRGKNIGSLTIPFIGENNDYYLTSGFTGEFELSIDELLRFLSQDEIPVQRNSTLYWSDEVTVGELID